VSQRDSELDKHQEILHNVHNIVDRFFQKPVDIELRPFLTESDGTPLAFQKRGSMYLSIEIAEALEECMASS